MTVNHVLPALAVIAHLVPAQESDFAVQFDDNVIGDGSYFAYHSRDKKFISELPELPRGPIWTADKDHPPLSAAVAIQKAIAKRKELVHDSEHWQWGLVSASLVPWEYEDGYCFGTSDRGVLHDPATVHLAQ